MFSFRNRKTFSVGEIRNLLEKDGKVVLRKENPAKGIVEFWHWRYDGKYVRGEYSYTKGSSGYIVHLYKRQLPLSSAVQEIKSKVSSGWELIW
ncbi:MAG: hypothetical protein ABIK77_03345 [candidate division WOR-3 bacterium]